MQKGLGEKRCKSKLAAKNGCDGWSVAKILIMTIQVNLVSIHSKAVMRQDEFT